MTMQGPGIVSFLIIALRFFGEFFCLSLRTKYSISRKKPGPIAQGK